jgi:hypothetical protein
VSRFAPDADLFITLQRLGFVRDLVALAAWPIIVTDVVWEIARQARAARSAPKPLWW